MTDAWIRMQALFRESKHVGAQLAALEVRQQVAAWARANAHHIANADVEGLLRICNAKEESQHDHE